MSQFRMEIKDFSSYDIINIRLMFFARNEPFLFEFNNATKGLEKLGLKVLDSAGNQLEKHSYMMISPRNWKSIYPEISQTEPFIYEFKGVVEEWEEDPNYVYFELSGGFASYLLKKGEKYSMYVRFRGETTNTIEVQY